MKTVLIILEGAADLPLEDLQGKTPLEMARMPQADRWAKSGCSGLLNPVQEDLDVRNEMMLACLVGLGADKATTLHRGPLEAVFAEADPAFCQYAWRANLVTLNDERLDNSRCPGLTLEETRVLAEAVQQRFDPDELKLVPIGPACLSVQARTVTEGTYPGCAPGLALGETVKNRFPGGRKGRRLLDIMGRAQEVLSTHAVNEVRVDLGENPANGLWLWGGGKLPRAEGGGYLGWPLGGCMISDSAMAHGLARLCGMKSISMDPLWDEEEYKLNVPGVVSALRDHERVIIYVQAPQENGNFGDARDKVRALGRMDQYLLAPLGVLLESVKPLRVALLADGLIASATGCPASGPIPFVAWGSDIMADETASWCERVAALGTQGVVPPCDFMEALKERMG